MLFTGSILFFVLFLDQYVKIYLMCQSERQQKAKTEIKMENLNPVYDQTFSFLIPRIELKSCGLHIKVMDYDKWGRNELIGEVLLSKRSRKNEIRHWNEALYKPNQTITEWHELMKLKSDTL